MKKILFYFIFFFCILKKNIILCKKLKEETFKSKISNYYNKLKISINRFRRDLAFFEGLPTFIAILSTPIMILKYFNNRYLKYIEMEPNEEIKIIIDPGNFLFSQTIKIGLNLTKIFKINNKNQITNDHCKKIFIILKNYISNYSHNDQKINPYLIDIKIKNENNLLILVINFSIKIDNKEIKQQKIHIQTNSFQNNIFHNIESEHYKIIYPTLNEYFSKDCIPSYYDTYYDILYVHTKKGFAYKYYSDFSWKIMHPWLS